MLAWIPPSGSSRTLRRHPDRRVHRSQPPVNHPEVLPAPLPGMTHRSFLSRACSLRECAAIPIPKYELRGLGFILAPSYLQHPCNTLSLGGSISRAAPARPGHHRRHPPIGGSHQQSLQQRSGRRLPSWILGGLQPANSIERAPHRFIIRPECDPIPTFTTVLWHSHWRASKSNYTSDFF